MKYDVPAPQKRLLAGAEKTPEIGFNVWAPAAEENSTSKGIAAT